VLRRISESKRDEVTGGWRKPQNEELNNLYSSPNINRMKSRRMGWAGHVPRMVVKRNAYRMVVGKPEGKDYYEDQDLGGWTILKWILQGQDGVVRTGSI
jgi:hypothetical protein